jgi:hypothetical protein
MPNKWDRTPLRHLLPLLEEWLMANFPTPYPVRVKYAPKIKYDSHYVAGLCWREGRKIEIRVRLAHSRRETIDTLLHEWAHAHVLRHEVMERRAERDHTPEWGLAFATIYSKLYDDEEREAVVE